MRKLLFILTLLSLMTVGCNRTENAPEVDAGGTPIDRQNEEIRGSEEIDIEGSEEQNYQQGQQGIQGEQGVIE